MADIALLKKLRDVTFAPMGDCKQALDEANGDFDQAQEILKKKGILKAGKKAERETNEGIVKLVQKDGKLVGIRLLCESDFVAKNEGFHTLSELLLDKLSAAGKDADSIAQLDPALKEELDTIVAEYVGKLGENMKLDNAIVSTKTAFVYNHPGNRVASIIFYEGVDNGVAKELALQVAAMNPTYCSFDEIDASEKEALMTTYRAELAASGKPANMIDQIAEGKLRKSLGDQVLLEQEYIRDGGKRVKEIVPSEFVVKSFVRLAI